MTNEAELLEVVKAARAGLKELGGLAGALTLLGRSDVAQAINRDVAAPIALALANLDRRNP